MYSQRLIALFTKKELCSAYATFEPTDDFADDHTTASDRIYNVPVYNTFDENNNVDSSSESNVSSYSQMEEIDLSLRDNHVNIPDRSSTYSRVSSGQETSSSAGSDSTSRYNSRVIILLWPRHLQDLIFAYVMLAIDFLDL